MASLLLPFKWQATAHYVYDEYLSKPYTSKFIQDDWQYIHNGITIPRPNHGLVHTLRTAAYVTYVVHAYNLFNQPHLTAQDIDHLQLALLFYVTGRENEAAFGNPDYLRFRQKSADAFERYIKQNHPQMFTDQKLQFYKQGIYDAYSTSPPQYVILRLCHDLDLLRCYPQVEYDKKIQSAKKHVGAFAKPLAVLAEECLQQTGDRIFGKQTYDGPLFTLCSTNVEETLRRINQVLQNNQGVFMQPVQPLPPGLEAPIPKTPWNVTPGLFARIQSQPGDSFTRCEVLPTDPEARFILHHFMHSKPHGYAIRKIYCIHNPAQTQTFEGRIKIIATEADNPAFAPKGKTETPQHERAQALQRWQACTTPFSPIKIEGPKRTDKFTEVKVLPLWHGSNQQKCQSICTSGFTTFGKHHYFNPAAVQGANASTDIGYFGSGIYFTNSAQYATMYANGHLLLSWVSMREPYPVVNDVPHPHQGSDMKKLKGHSHYQNYNAHYIPVASIKPHKPDCMEYYPCYGNQVPAWDEFVVFDKSQTLPRFWIELGVDTPQHPLANPLVAVPPQPAAVQTPLQPLQNPFASTLVAVQLQPAAVQASLQPLQKPFAQFVVVDTPQHPLANPLVAAPPQPAAVQASLQPLQKPFAQPTKAPELPAGAFGATEWRKHFGDVGLEPPLPKDIQQILSSPCPFWPGRKVHETHLLVLVPQTVNGQPLTLKLLGELVQKPLEGPATKYSYFHLVQHTDTAAPPSHWVLMSRDVIEGSRNESYSAQQALLRDKTQGSYEVPRILDTTVCILMEHVRTGKRLYSDSPVTLTRCQEKFSADWQLVVGAFAPGGLFFGNCGGAGHYALGVGGSRKF